MKSFEELGLSENILKALKKRDLKNLLLFRRK